jgi:hypothetical protein
LTPSLALILVRVEVGENLFTVADDKPDR